MPDAYQTKQAQRRATRRAIPGELNARERGVLEILVQMHAELSHDHGLNTRFTSEAVEHIAGPCTGSLAALVMYGYVKQQSDPDGIAYSVTERGYMLFAGIEGKM